jgi:hypothetical protein
MIELNQIIDIFFYKVDHGRYAKTEWKGIMMIIPLIKQLACLKKCIKTLEFTPHSNSREVKRSQNSDGLSG